MIYQSGGDAINRQQSELLATQQRIASGRRLLTPADDPAAATQALAVAASKATTVQYAANIGVAQDALAIDETVLAQVTDALQGIRTLAVNGGSGSLSDADRNSIADQLTGQLADLVGLANSRGGDGNYLFSGYAVDTQPFTTTAAGVAYQGDQGQRHLDVGSGRTMAVSEHGDAIFMLGASGNGTFEATATPGNPGSGVIDAGSVTDASALTGHSYRLVFTGTGQFDVFDATAGANVSTGNAYTAGNAIALPGMQVTVTGAPAAGATFDVKPSTPRSVFATVQSLIDTLRTPGSSPAGRATIANGIGQALSNLDQGLGAVLTVRSGLGAGLAELDALATGNDSMALQYDTTISRLVDVDYARALSEFAQQQMSLEAAQKSFLKVSGLSLFNYL